MPSDVSGGGDSGPARLVIRLLGSVETTLDGHRLEAFSSLRLQRFLGLLVLRPDLQHRARIAFELWPESEEGQARTNLRKLLHELRHALPDVAAFVDIDNEMVRWIATGPAEVDVVGFREAVASGDLELAAQRYSGDLLPACYDDWVLDERAKLRAEAYEVFGRLADGAAASRDHRTTISRTARILELEPADEAAVRLQMEAHLALGDRAGALRVYHRCSDVLERELGVAPSDATDALYQQVRADTSRPESGQLQEPTPVVDSPFVGRDHELNQLHETWTTVRRGEGHLALISGEPGIGKTRLARELARDVRGEGHLVATARAYEAAGRPPWGPVVDLLRSDRLRGQIDTLEPVWKSELARLLPELHEPTRSMAPNQSTDMTQRYRLFDAASRALVVGDRPRLLVIDDLQWCDTETIELIGFVVRSLRTAPVLIVGTVRSEEVTPDHPLGDLVDALEREQAVTTVALERFDESTTTALASRMGDTDTIDPELAERLFSETEGNPLFVIEALRAGLSSERGSMVLTPTIRAVLRSRLDQLSDGPRRLTEVAAVIGRPFSVDLLASATSIDEHVLVDQIDELWRRRIIRDQGHDYDFSHDKLRAVALELVSPARRRQLHRAVAGAIEARADHDRDAASPQLAAHYDQAGMVEAAIAAYRLAGTRAVAVSALDEAVTMFRRALSLLADVPASPERDALELDLRIALGSPLVALDGYGSSGVHQLYERALSLCRKLQRPVDPPILRGLGLAQLQGCRFEDCRQHGQALFESRDPVARTEGRYLLGVSAFWQGDLALARHHLEGAIDAYDVANRGEHLASYAQDPKAVCLVRLAWVELWSGDPGRAAQTARVALDLAGELDHLMTSWYVVTYAAIIAAESEDLARLAELLDDAHRLWRRLPMPYLMIVLDALQGWLDLRHGSAEGMVVIERSVERSRVDRETLHLTYTLLLLARGHGAAENPAAGRLATREGLEWSDTRDQRYLEAELWRTDGELAHECDDPQAAAASLGRAVEVASSQAAAWLELRALHSRAALLGDEPSRAQLGELLGTLPSGHDLAPFQTASSWLDESS